MTKFEVFTRRSSRGGGSGPAVTRQRGGIYSLNQEAFEMLGRPEAVELLFDREEQVMGFRSAAKDLPHTYAVRPQAKSSSLLVSGRAFNQHYGIVVDTSRRYPATMMDDVLAIDFTNSDAVESWGSVKAVRE